MVKIGKMCGVSDVAVLKWIRKEAEKVEPLNPKSDSGIVMLDEMWHFVNGKENHTTCDCKYHVVFIPKYRRKVLFDQIKNALGVVFRELALRKECTIEEGHIMEGHVHMLISIPPKHSVAQVVGFIKGKSAIWIA